MQYLYDLEESIKVRQAGRDTRCPTLSHAEPLQLLPRSASAGEPHTATVEGDYRPMLGQTFSSGGLSVTSFFALYLRSATGELPSEALQKQLDLWVLQQRGAYEKLNEKTAHRAGRSAVCLQQPEQLRLHVKSPQAWSLPFCLVLNLWYKAMRLPVVEVLLPSMVPLSVSVGRAGQGPQSPLWRQTGITSLARSVVGLLA